MQEKGKAVAGLYKIFSMKNFFPVNRNIFQVS